MAARYRQPRSGHRSKRAQVLLDEWKQFHKWRHLALGLRFTIVLPSEWPSKGDFFSSPLVPGTRGSRVSDSILLYAVCTKRNANGVLSRHAHRGSGCEARFKDVVDVRLLLPPARPTLGNPRGKPATLGRLTYLSRGVPHGGGKDDGPVRSFSRTSDSHYRGMRYKVCVFIGRLE
jgi:hypothetical protein